MSVNMVFRPYFVSIPVLPLEMKQASEDLCSSAFTVPSLFSDAVFNFCDTKTENSASVSLRTFQGLRIFASKMLMWYQFHRFEMH